MDYSDPHPGRYSRRLAFLRLGCGPGLHLLHIRHVNPHLGTQVQIFPRDGQPVFLGDALGLLGGDVSLDAPSSLSFMPAFSPTLYFLRSLGMKKPFAVSLSVNDQNAFAGGKWFSDIRIS
jgi:hypothetical protein